MIISGPTNNGFPPLSVMNTPTCCGYYLPIPTSTNTINGNTIYVQCCMGPPMVNSDGWGYVEYEVRNVVNNVITSDNLYLQQIAPTDNNFPTTLLSSTTQNQALLPGPIIPDGQGGILATWTISPSNPPVPQYPYQAVDVVAGLWGRPITCRSAQKLSPSGNLRHLCSARAGSRSLPTARIQLTARSLLLLASRPVSSTGATRLEPRASCPLSRRIPIVVWQSMTRRTASFNSIRVGTRRK